MFKIGDYVVYGTNGVCRIDSIGTLNMGMGDREYYTLTPVYEKKSKLFIPVDNQKIVMRPVLTRQETDKLIDEIQNIDVLCVEDEKKREEVYKEAMRTCDSKQWVRIIKTLYLRKLDRMQHGKKATSSDEKYLHMAQQNLYGEMAFALEIPKEEVEHFIAERMQEKH
ncbi:MAG: CarD family transcriptional regulator [Lachnospiraceae bacterium]|nr:CarD family transcriptional regulator [Lachnospiraceae bacterium]